jgi:hypothetical protein
MNAQFYHSTVEVRRQKQSRRRGRRKVAAGQMPFCNRSLAPWAVAIPALPKLRSGRRTGLGQSCLLRFVGSVHRTKRVATGPVAGCERVERRCGVLGRHDLPACGTRPRSDETKSWRSTCRYSSSVCSSVWWFLSACVIGQVIARPWLWQTCGASTLRHLMLRCSVSVDVLLGALFAVGAKPRNTRECLAASQTCGCLDSAHAPSGTPSFGIL